MIINETNRYYRLKKGSVVGKARSLFPSEISSVEPMDVDEGLDPDDDLKEIKVPEGHRRHITQLVRGNKDLFAKRDKDLSHIDSVKMSIRTHPNQQPLRNRPYRTPLNKRKIINQAIDKMLEAKVIERSQSPWSFPLVVVKKKDGSDMMCVDTSFEEDLESSLDHTLNFCRNLVIFRSKNICQKESLTRSSMVI